MKGTRTVRTARSRPRHTVRGRIAAPMFTATIAARKSHCRSRWRSAARTPAREHEVAGVEHERRRLELDEPDLARAGERVGWVDHGRELVAHERERHEPLRVGREERHADVEGALAHRLLDLPRALLAQLERPRPRETKSAAVRAVPVLAGGLVAGA